MRQHTSIFHFGSVRNPTMDKKHELELINIVTHSWSILSQFVLTNLKETNMRLPWKTKGTSRIRFVLYRLPGDSRIIGNSSLDECARCSSLTLSIGLVHLLGKFSKNHKNYCQKHTQKIYFGSWKTLHNLLNWVISSIYHPVFDKTF